jgi:hypothetical protein
MPGLSLIQPNDPVFVGAAERIRTGKVSVIRVQADLINAKGAPRSSAICLHQYPLYKAKYKREGGHVHIHAAWPASPSGRPNPRVMILEGQDWVNELVFLKEHFIVQNMDTGAKTNLYDEIYGTGTKNRLAEVLKMQWETYDHLLKIATEEKRGLTDAEVVRIAECFTEDEEGLVQDFTIGGIEEVLPVSAELIGLTESLTKAGLPTELAKTIAARAVEDGLSTDDDLDTIPGVSDARSQAGRAQRKLIIGAIEAWRSLAVSA